MKTGFKFLIAYQYKYLLIYKVHNIKYKSTEKGLIKYNWNSKELQNIYHRLTKY